MIITRYSQMLQAYDDLGPGDLFIGRIPASHLRTALWIDLTARGVRILPSVTAQMVSASKAAQAFLFKPWMVPHTRLISRRKDLLDAVGQYARHRITAAVTKQEHLHCGHGVRRWNDLETMYSCLSLSEEHYPFVLQPFVAAVADVRVIMVGDYCEAYARHNPDGFRMNLAAGGRCQPHALTAAQRVLCQEAMDRAQMPYAHIDLILTETGGTYLSEINLNGGTAGARTARGELDQMKQQHLMKLAEALNR
jgi:ribosomal protein S6--L-glutamate ligase